MIKLLIIILVASVGIQAQTPFDDFLPEGKKIPILELKDKPEFRVDNPNPDGILKYGTFINDKFYFYGENEKLIFTYTLDANDKKWWSVDPKASSFPSHSPYNSMLGNPINMVDPGGDSTEVPKGMFANSPIGPYPEGYNQQGLNLGDWGKFSNGIRDISGINLSTPQRSDKHLKIDNIDNSIGSSTARGLISNYLTKTSFSLQSELHNNSSRVHDMHFDPVFISNSSGIITGMDLNKSILRIDIADFDKITYSGVSPLTYSIGSQFVHELYHGNGVGDIGRTLISAQGNGLPAEISAIQMTNAVRVELGLTQRFLNFNTYAAPDGRSFLLFGNTQVNNRNYNSVPKVFVP